ncbi:Piso0_000838 [Millerozyma farinosa CBS 7064]|uniref:Pre-mRNA-splicing factor CWC24 n=1 Tax=Pichia sorbitophila (strain ATCC MYA-4447 / BCRC 22081 / CBS 7064 / NBRC 10061 / NRRL Y-12695) TaxID=559304 RepID=G8YQ73_PICSO|nr:Piso0_000838 [Millerozyma farinosa CBS 7064]
MFKKRVVKRPEQTSSARTKRHLDEEDFSPGDDLEETSRIKTESLRGGDNKSDSNIGTQSRPEISSGASSVSKKQKTDTRRDEVNNKESSQDSSEESGEEKQTEGQRPPSGPDKPQPKNVRATTVTDFQPDVCKDFWQTGYCGYGDTCKFLHVRDESRQRQPVEKEWEQVNITDGSRNMAAPGQSDQPVPHKCLLCRRDYSHPVRTECDHYFCQSCFLARCKKKSTSCMLCGKDTGGVCVPVAPSELQRLIS